MQKNKINAPIYKLDDFQYAPNSEPMPPPYPFPSDESKDEEAHPWFKKVLCGDNLFGNIFYPLWRDATCHCCSLWRGVLVGILITTPVLYILSQVF